MERNEATAKPVAWPSCRSRHIHYKCRPTLAPHGRIYPISRNLLLFESIIDCPTGDSSIAATVVQRQRLRSPPTAEFSPAAFVVHSATSASDQTFSQNPITQGLLHLEGRKGPCSFEVSRDRPCQQREGQEGPDGLGATFAAMTSGWMMPGAG